jgi:hypothetical protein
VKLPRSIWVVLPLAFVAALGALAIARDGDPTVAPERPAATAPPVVPAELASADLRGATATLARRAPSFNTQAKRALKKADKVLAADSKRANAALAEWAADESSSADGVIAAVGRLRKDVGSLRRAVAKLKAKDRKSKRARSYISSSLVQTDKGLRGLSGALVLGDPAAGQDLIGSALRSFAKADALAKKASIALGCKRPCSRAL